MIPISPYARKCMVCLDRDGVINKGGKINDPSEMELIDGVPEAIASLKQAGYVVGCVTNQGGLGEGLNGEIVWPGHPLTREMLQKIHEEMNRQLGPEAQLDFIQICPHFKVRCDCRKPAPGMLKQAAKDHKITLSPACYMVGDMVTDIQAGLRAGVTPIFVLSGHAPEQRDQCPPGTIILPSLKEAAQYILEQRRNQLKG